MAPRRKRSKVNVASQRGQTTIRSFFSFAPGPSSPSAVPLSIRKASATKASPGGSSAPVSERSNVSSAGSEPDTRGKDLKSKTERPRAIDVDLFDEEVDLSDPIPRLKKPVDAPESSTAKERDGGPALVRSASTPDRVVKARRRRASAEPRKRVLRRSSSKRVTANPEVVLDKEEVPRGPGFRFSTGDSEVESEESGGLGMESRVLEKDLRNTLDSDVAPSESASGFDNGTDGGAEVEADDDIPMTQEEVEVNEQLQSLNCSQGEDVNDERHGSGVESSTTDTPRSGVGSPLKPNGLDADGDTVMTSSDKPGDAPVRDDHGVASNDLSSLGTPKKEPRASPRDSDLDSPATAPSNSPSSYVTANGSTPEETGKAESESDDDDLLLPIAGPRTRSASSRRSTRAPERFDPCAGSEDTVPLTGASVFGSALGGRRRRGPAGRKTATAARLQKAHEAHAEEEKEIEALRTELESGQGIVAAAATGDEAMFAELAAVQEEQSVIAKKKYDKYDRPVPFFVGQVSIPAPNPVLWTREPRGVVRKSRVRSNDVRAFVGLHPLRSLLIEAKSCAPKDINFASLIPGDLTSWAIDIEATGDVEDGGPLVEMLFELIAYDPTQVNIALGKSFSHVGHRGQILQILLDVIYRYPNVASSLPPLGDVLAVYGARFEHVAADAALDTCKKPSSDHLPSGSCNSSLTDEVSFKTRSMEKGSLDFRFIAVDGVDECQETLRCVRNINRVLQVFSAAVVSGLELSLVARRLPKWSDLTVFPIDPSLSQDPELSSAMALANACVRIMMSPFGSEVAGEAGQLLAAVMDRISADKWPRFRWEAAKTLASLSDRLNLHVALARHLIPCTSIRSRCLQLDFTYLCLGRWCTGPGHDPEPSSVSSRDPITRSQRSSPNGVELGFALADVVKLLSEVPEFSKETDVVWGCGVAELAKLVVSDEDVMESRRVGDVASLNESLKSMRKLSSRMGGLAEVQSMRLALDALRAFLAGHGKTDRRVFLELNPHEKGSKKQASIHLPVVHKE